MATTHILKFASHSPNVTISRHSFPPLSIRQYAPERRRGKAAKFVHSTAYSPRLSLLAFSYDRRRCRQSPHHDRELRHHHHHHQQYEGLDAERRRRQHVRGNGPPPEVGTKREWDLFDAVLDERRQRRRRLLLQQRRQEGEKEADAAENEGFHKSKGGGAGGGGREEGRGAEAHLRSGFRLDHRPERKYQRERRRQWRQESVLSDPRKSGDESADGVHHRKAFFWEGPGGWNGPAAAERTTGIRESGGGVGGGWTAAGDGDRGDGGVEAGIPTFSEVLVALKKDMWSAPVAFRPAVSLCGQRNSPFDSIIPFERLQVIRVIIVVVVVFVGRVVLLLRGAAKPRAQQIFVFAL